MVMHKKAETALAFDFGLKQIGVAFGQTITSQAHGIEILNAKNGIPNWREIEGLIEEWDPTILIVGLPIDMNNMESRITMAAKKFAVKLNKKFKQPVKLVDEKLSSREAKYQARETSKSVNLARVDHLAAALILQTYLNHPESAKSI